MNSKQGIEKRNSLGKPKNYPITSNEYILDLLPVPLFSVDILDSQALANIVSVGNNRHENSHMIHIMSIDNSIWRREVYLKMYFKTKIRTKHSVVQERA